MVIEDSNNRIDGPTDELLLKLGGEGGAGGEGSRGGAGGEGGNLEKRILEIVIVRKHKLARAISMIN